jgi:hypothetical protein
VQALNVSAGFDDRYDFGSGSVQATEQMHTNEACGTGNSNTAG